MLKVNKEQLLNTKLNMGSPTVDFDGKPCVKCSFISAAGVEGNVTDQYYDLIDIYEDYYGESYQRANKYGWRLHYPEVCSVLDNYERDLMKTGCIELPKLVEDLEGLVEWV